MSGFHELGDEFAGDEANDEWDATWAAYAAGDQPLSDAETLPLRTVLDLPIGMVEIRGDDPGIGLCLIESPEERRSQSTPESEFDVDSEDSPALTMTLTTDDAGRADFLVLNAGGEVVGTGALEDHESASELLDHLVAASIATDVSRVYLKAACVEVAGRGVLILSSDESARDAVTKGLVGAGARYLTDSVVATNPGIRPISGLPRRRAGAEATKTVQSVVVDVVLIIDSDADVSRGPHAEPEAIADVQAVVELAHFVHPGSRTHPMSLAHVAALVAGASCHRVNPADTPQLAGFLPLLPKARRSLLVVTDLSDTAGADVGWVTNDTQVPDGTASTDTPPGETLLLRFGDGALVSQASEGIRVIDTDAIQAIEQRLAVDDRRRLVPAGFGLPGCPVGNAVADLWKTTTADALPRTLPTGVVAELISRELVGADEATRERLIDVHAVARSRRDEAVSLLEEILGAAGQLAAQLVILGDFVDSLDGVLPPHFTDVKDLNLLVPAEIADELVEILETLGIVREPVTLTTTSLESGRTLALGRVGEGSVKLELYRTLASGPFGVLVDPGEFHRTAVPFRVGERWASALHPAHRFIHACVRFDGASRNDMGLARSVILNAPRTSALSNQMLDMAERWGATATVLSVLAELDKVLPGVPAYLSSVAAGRTDRSKRNRRIGRRS